MVVATVGRAIGLMVNRIATAAIALCVLALNIQVMNGTMEAAMTNTSSCANVQNPGTWVQRESHATLCARQTLTRVTWPRCRAWTLRASDLLSNILALIAQSSRRAKTIQTCPGWSRGSACPAPRRRHAKPHLRARSASALADNHNLGTWVHRESHATLSVRQCLTRQRLTHVTWPRCRAWTLRTSDMLSTIWALLAQSSRRAKTIQTCPG